MKNTICAHCQFSFKGETHHLSTTFDLDTCMSEEGHLANLYPLLAKHNSIDTYSYLYEVMEAHELTFSAASGLAADCMVNGEFDIGEFERRWQGAHMHLLQPIAKRYLDIDDLERHADLKNALIAAYNAGRAASA